MTKATALINARIYVDWHNPPVEALHLERGLVRLAGTNRQILSVSPDSTKKFDMQGMTIWPGLCDAHLHLEHLSNQLASINCEGLSKAEILELVRLKAQSLPNGAWIIGFGFNQNDWTPPEYGTAQELDAVSAHNPVLLHAKSLHAAWVNTQAMRIAGIDPKSPNLPADTFLKEKDGSAKGILLEHAIEQIAKCIPQKSPRQLANDLLETQAYLHSLGITSVHEFDDIALANALLTLNAQDKLRLRVMKNMRLNSWDLITQGDYRQTLNAGNYLRAGWLKLFADGALGPQSAAMLAPYENTQNKGILLMSEKEIESVGLIAREHGWSLSIHAIGDLATQTSLNAIERVNRAKTSHNNTSLLPHRIEHIQALDPTDLSRFNALGVVASIQPVHATSDHLVAERLWGERCQHAYAYKSLQDSGAELFLGTDAPVEIANPFHTLYAAITRQTLAGEPNPDGWYPAQRLNMHQALDGMTVNPARYFGTPAQTGTLKPGSNADFIVLEKDPFILSPIEMAKIKPVMTWVAGKCVYTS